MGTVLMVKQNLRKYTILGGFALLIVLAGTLLWAAELASDNFNRADANPIAGNWTTGTGDSAIQLVGNEVRGVTSGSRSSAYYNAITWPDNQYSELQITAMDSASSAGPVTRRSASAQTLYLGHIPFPLGSAATREVYKQITGTFTLLGSASINVLSTDVMRLDSQGTTTVLSQNGTARITVTDSAIASGNAAMSVDPNVVANSRMDNWAGGDFAAGGTRHDLPIMGCCNSSSSRRLAGLPRPYFTTKLSQVFEMFETTVSAQTIYSFSLSRIIGKGTQLDPFRAEVTASGLGFECSIPTLADGTPRFSFALCRSAAVMSRADSADFMKFPRMALDMRMVDAVTPVQFAALTAAINARLPGVSLAGITYAGSSVREVLLRVQAGLEPTVPPADFWWNR